MSQFSYRPARSSDLARCIELFQQDGARGALLDEALLTQLLHERVLTGYAFEEHGFTGNAKIWGCGFSAFISPEVAAQACRGEISHVVELLLSSHRGPAPMLLSRAQQAHFNAAGQLHLVVLNFAIDDAPLAPVTEIVAISSKAFLTVHSGYGLRSYLVEVREHERKAAMYRQSALAMGCAAAPAAPGAATQVFFFDDEKSGQHPFHTHRTLFLRRPPHIGLTAAQQDLLVLAMRGHNDTQIASELGIALDTVHKRWRAIFERAERAVPGLFGEADATRVRHARGGEKRRPLLTFLETHPEELRPWPRNA